MGQTGKKFSKEVQDRAAQELESEMQKPPQPQKLNKRQKALNKEAKAKQAEITPELNKMGLSNTQHAQKMVIGKEEKMRQLQQRMDAAQKHGNEMDAQVVEYRMNYEEAKRDMARDGAKTLTKGELAQINQKEKAPAIPDRATKPKLVPKNELIKQNRAQRKSPNLADDI